MSPSGNKAALRLCDSRHTPSETCLHSPYKIYPNLPIFLSGE
nr:MAG TPA: hypothetical protein [Caudoviricetes sp.]